jgi:predicted transcriptional regulator
MTTKNKDLVFGDVELDDVEFEPRHVKVRVTTMLDEDVLNALKKIASSKGQKYQTILNQVLRAFVERKKERKLIPVGERRIREIVREEMRKRA